MKILAVNPGSTSTKAAVFVDGEPLWMAEAPHPRAELDAAGSLMDQVPLRLAAVERLMAGHPATEAPFAAVMGRGGLLPPLPGGVYAVDADMLEELASARHGEHACNLGAFMARDLAKRLGCPAMVADPPVSDELDDAARLTGFPGITRRSLYHALSQRGAARAAAARLGVRYEDACLIVAHLGGGISVGAHRQGRVADVSNALDGEGPYGPERSGAVPVLPLLDLIESGRMDIPEARRRILSRGGLLGLAGSNDLRELEARMDQGDGAAALIFEAMVLSIAKTICSMAAVLAPLRPDAVVVTGGMAQSSRLTAAITGRVAFLGPVLVMAGVEEMRALAEAGRLALAGAVPVQSFAQRPG